MSQKNKRNNRLMLFIFYISAFVFYSSCILAVYLIFSNFLNK